MSQQLYTDCIPATIYVMSYSLSEVNIIVRLNGKGATSHVFTAHAHMCVSGPQDHLMTAELY